MMRIALLLVLFLTAAMSILWGAARAFDAAEEHRVTYRYIAAAHTPLPEAKSHVEWGPPSFMLVRPFTDADAAAIGRALGEAWQLLAIAQESGNADLIADRFTGVAETRALRSVQDASAHGGRMVVLDQTATPIFFHKDGSLFQAEVEMTVVRYLATDNHGLDAIEVTRDTGIATFLNETTGWRLMSWERRTSDALAASPAPFAGPVFGLNYYPSETPWRDFWPEFDVNDVARDFDLVRTLNADSVRVFLTRDAFLGETSDASLERLKQLLALAEDKGLRVVPTLFDLKQDYGLGTWADDALYLEHVLPVLRASPAVSFVDLKNEPDLDFDAHGTAKVTAWLETMISLTRAGATGLPLTIGWSSAEAAELLVDRLDVVTYHDYAPLDGTATRLNAVRRIAGEKPVYITEIGDTSFGLAFGIPGSETTQADRLKARIEALSAADGIMVWTLFDFPEVDPSVVGASPWVKRLQSSFGVLRADGTEKPGAEVLRTLFAREN